MPVADFLTDTMNVMAKGNTQGLNAGAGRTDSVRQANIPCFIMDSTGGQAYVGGARAAIDDHPIVTEYDDIHNGDTVVITNTLGVVVTCRVDGVDQRRARGGIGQFCIITVQEIETGA